MNPNAKKTQRVNVNHFLFFFELFLAAAFFLILPLRSISIRHMIVLAGSIGLYLIAFTRLISSRIRTVEFVCLSLILVVLLFGLLLGQGRVSFDLIYNSLNYLSFLIIFFTENNFSLDDRMEKTILSAAIIMTLAMVVARFSPSAFLFEDGRSNGALALGMTNSNMTGMMIFAVYSLVLVYYRKNKKQLHLLPVLALLLYFLLLTRARSCIISAVIVTVYALLFSHVKVPKAVVVLVVFVPILFVPIYLRLYESGFTYNLILGKTLYSGRQYTYLSYLRLLRYNYQLFLGNLKEVGFGNAHNAPLSIFLSTGLIGAGAAYFCFIRKLLRLCDEANTDDAHVAIVCLLSFFIQSSAEALMFTGYYTCSIFVYIFLLITGSQEIDEEEEAAASD